MWKAQIGIVSDSWLGCRSMTCWTCEQQLRQSAVHLQRRISESIFIAACTTTTKTEQNSVCSVKSEAELYPCMGLPNLVDVRFRVRQLSCLRLQNDTERSHNTRLVGSGITDSYPACVIGLWSTTHCHPNCEYHQR